MYTPVVIDNNPELPPMNKITNKHKYLLEIDEELTKIIEPDNIFVSYRSNKTIKDLLIKNKFIDEEEEKNTGENNNDIGCKRCNKCYLCKWYMNETNTFTSHHTNQIFNIRDKLTCEDKGVIYLVECNVHNLSYVGYTTGNMKARFSNDKSHVKAKRKTCEKVTHLIEIDHDIDFSNYRKYDETLSKCVTVTLIEKVKNIKDNDDLKTREEKCEKRENFWQKR